MIVYNSLMQNGNRLNFGFEVQIQWQTFFSVRFLTFSNTAKTHFKQFFVILNAYVSFSVKMFFFWPNVVHAISRQTNINFETTKCHQNHNIVQVILQYYQPKWKFGIISFQILVYIPKVLKLPVDEIFTVELTLSTSFNKIYQSFHIMNL